MLFFEGLGFYRLGFQVRVDLRLVSVVISESRMNLRQRQVAKVPHDLLRNQTHVVPLSNSADGDAGSGNAWAPAANIGTSRDQAAYLGHLAVYFPSTLELRTKSSSTDGRMPSSKVPRAVAQRVVRKAAPGGATLDAASLGSCMYITTNTRK